MGYTFPFSIPGFSSDEMMPYDANMLALDAGNNLGFEATLNSSPNAPAPNQPAPVAGSISGSYTNPARTARLDQIGAQLADLQKLQADRLEGATKTPKMSGDQALVTAIGGLLPMILGRALAGNAGGAIGAQAGGTFATAADAGIKEQNKEEQAKALTQYTKGEVDLKDLQSQRNELQKEGFTADDTFQTKKLEETNKRTDAANTFANQEKLHKEPTYKDLHPTGGGNKDAISDPNIAELNYQQLKQKYPDAPDEQLRAAAKSFRSNNSLLTSSSRDAVKDPQILDMAKKTALADSISEGTSALRGILKEHPEFANYGMKDILAKIPNNTPVYNQIQNLIIAGAQSAKVLEGRVNETTLGLYTGFTSPKTTETFANALDRADMLSNILRNDASLSERAYRAAGKKTGTLGDLINKPSGQGVKIGEHTYTPEQVDFMKQQGMIK